MTSPPLSHLPHPLRVANGCQPVQITSSPTDRATEATRENRIKHILDCLSIQQPCCVMFTPCLSRVKFSLMLWLRVNTTSALYSIYCSCCSVYCKCCDSALTLWCHSVVAVIIVLVFILVYLSLSLLLHVTVFSNQTICDRFSYVNLFTINPSSIRHPSIIIRNRRIPKLSTYHVIHSPWNNGSTPERWRNIISHLADYGYVRSRTVHGDQWLYSIMWTNACRYMRIMKVCRGKNTHTIVRLPYSHFNTETHYRLLNTGSYPRWTCFGAPGNSLRNGP